MPTRHTYGADPAQLAELTLPDGEPRGVAVVVHGGFWKPEYGIEYARPLVPSLAAEGWAVWAVEYRRGAGAAATLTDVADAIRACPDLPGPRVAIGHSAGAHLAVWAGGQGVGLTHVVAQAGVLDLRAAHRDGLGGGAVERFLGHPPGPADAEVDPLAQVPLDVPVWCIHAVDDVDVPLTQSRTYVDAARATGGEASLLEVEGDHFTLIDPASQAWASTLTWLRSLR
ncbi:alpha/beta hydrolase family protein [Nocardioides kongjuensis]|uniref:Acetyl esterase/lipase n=1 Tax=Nocardioides kongjuensis TaxID=349522 RepID=A0A852RV78_9ACTN|nr:acetyl esterase/lipase [Nocardioides kongjuensis]